LLSDLGGQHTIILIVLEEVIGLLVGQKGIMGKVILAYREEGLIIEVLGQMGEVAQELVLVFWEFMQLILLH